MVANFGFNCKNGKVSPILRLHAITRVRITPKLNFCPKFCQKWSFKFNLIISNVWCQIVLVPNCPVPNCPGAKLSWCQIVLVPNCPLLLSWCQIVRFYYLGAKLSALLSWCQIVRCQIVRFYSWCQIVLESISKCWGCQNHNQNSESRPIKQQVQQFFFTLELVLPKEGRDPSKKPPCI